MTELPAGTLIVVEWALGADIDGGDATKAAKRAVATAIRNVVLPGLRSLVADTGRKWRVNVRLGVPAGASAVDEAAVLAELPYRDGATIEVVQGGLATPNGLSAEGRTTIVVAAVEIRLA